MSFPSDRADAGVDVRVALKPSDKDGLEAGEMTDVFWAHYEETDGLKSSVHHR